MSDNSGKLNRAKGAFAYWLSIQNPMYKKSLADIEGNGEPLYHISNNGQIRRFFPVIPMQTKPGEDRSIARICTSNRIIDAFVGMLDTSALDRLNINKEPLTIYRFCPTLSVRPTKKALPNNSNLNERWIVGYDPTYSDYSSVVDGKIFVTKGIVDEGVIVVEGYILSYSGAMLYNSIDTGPNRVKKFWLCCQLTDEGVVTHKVTIEDSKFTWGDLTKGL